MRKENTGTVVGWFVYQIHQIYDMKLVKVVMNTLAATVFTKNIKLLYTLHYIMYQYVEFYSSEFALSMSLILPHKQLLER